MSDKLRVTCPSCQATIKVGSAYRGKVVPCPSCRTHLQMPAVPAHPVPELDEVVVLNNPPLVEPLEEEDDVRPPLEALGHWAPPLLLLMALLLLPLPWHSNGAGWLSLSGWRCMLGESNDDDSLNLPPAYGVILWALLSGTGAALSLVRRDTQRQRYILLALALCGAAFLFIEVAVAGLPSVRLFTAAAREYRKNVTYFAGTATLIPFVAFFLTFAAGILAAFLPCPQSRRRRS